MAEIKVGENFYKNGEEVTITKFCKIVVDNKEYEGVVYNFTKNKGEENAIVENKSDFINSVIHTTLNIGDNIMAVCMGKILTVYKVSYLAGCIASASDGSSKVQFLRRIRPNGMLDKHTCFEGDMPKGTEYYLVSSYIEKILTVKKLINSCLSKIGNIQKTLSSSIKIDYSNVDVNELKQFTLNLDNFKKDIYKTLKLLKNE